MLERLKELLGLGTDQPVDNTAELVAGRSDADLATDRDAVKETLASRDDLSVDEVKQIVAYGKAVRDEIASRATMESDIADLTAEDDTDEGDTDEPKAEDEPTADTPPATVSDVDRPADNAPVDDAEIVEPDEVIEPEGVLVAAAGGEIIESAEDLGTAMQAAHSNTQPPSGGGSVRHKAFGKMWDLPFEVDPDDKAQRAYSVIRAAFNAAQETARDFVYGNNQERALQAAGLGVIQAASGICGPLDPRYSFLQLASATSGLINLADVQTNRGGLRLPQALTVYDLRAEEGIADEYTSADGAAGVTKQTYTVSCPSISDFTITAYQTNLRFSNFQGQFFPEYVSHVTEVSMAHHAHVVNAALIDAVIASSDTSAYAVGAAEEGSAWASFTRQVTFHTFLYRDKYRTAQDLVLDVVLPYRALGALIADVAAHDSTRTDEATFAVAEKLAAFGRTVGARFQFVYDYQPMVETPGDFGSEDYEFLVFPAGEVQHMTAATLDLGVVRDSTRNAQNEFDTWVETFDGIATAGYEIMRITGMDLCPNGETGARVSITCGTGS